ncbi:MAG: ABC transporter permease subunit [Oscillospiraceae bacterium]
MKFATSKTKIAGSAKVSELKHFKRNLPLTALALPGIIFIFIFNYIPLYGLILPFKNYKASLGFFKSPWVGLKNFEFLFSGNEIINATYNTIVYNLIFIVLGTLISVILALMLYEINNRAVKIYQTVLFLPYFVSWVVVAYIVKAFLDIDYGFVNNLLEKFGMEPVMWYSEPDRWPPILIATNVWKNMGYNAIIYYAALMGVDKTLHEAARIDGANKIKEIIHVSIPMLVPMITILTILNIGKIFYGDFGLFYNVPLDSSLLYPTTDVIDTYVYRGLMGLGDIGMSSAAGFYQAVVGFILVLATNFAVKKIDSDNALF